MLKERAVKLAILVAATMGMIIGGAGVAFAGTSPAPRTATIHLGTRTLTGTVRMFKVPRAVTLPGRSGKTVRVPGRHADATAYEIVNQHSGLCMEVYHSELSEYANVDQYSCNGSATQYWVFYQVGTFDNNGTYLPIYEFVNDNSGLCAEVYHSEVFDGANVDQYSCNGTPTQHWIDLENGLFLNDNAFLYLEVYHSSTANYGNVDVWQYNGTGTQFWYEY